MSGWRSIVAANVVACAVALPQLSMSGSVLDHDRSPSSAAPRLADGAEASTMRSDGTDGWYAIAEVAASCQLPVDKWPPGLADVKLIEHYDLKIVGTSHKAAIEAIGPIHWAVGDRFVAHVVPLHGLTERHPRLAATLGGPCNAAGVHDMLVGRLVPIERDERGTLEQIMAHGWPVTDLSPIVWPVRSADRRIPLTPR